MDELMHLTVKIIEDQVEKPETSYTSSVASSFHADTVKLHHKGELEPLLSEAVAKNRES